MNRCRHLVFCSRCKWPGALLLGAAAALYAPAAPAQIRTDASLGQAARSLIGPNYLIPESLGKLSGNNLFHSFQTFSINTAESARFTTTSANLANVIARVTGGSASTINGMLSLQPAGGTPNFFFINPAGVTFGAGAAVNVPGAFYVSTANYLKFPDGNFYSDTVTPSTFSSASPEAFGFLGNSGAAIAAVNATPQNLPGQPPRPSMFVGTDKPIHIVAGEVTISNSIIGNESGDVRIVALGKPQQETLVALSGSHAGAAGALQILNGGQINSSTNGNKDVGSVQVYAGDITIDKQTATRDTGIISQSDFNASGLAGDVTVIASGDLIMLNGAKISASNNATAANPAALTTGILTVMARNVTLDNAQILAESRGNVDATTIKVAAAGSQATAYGAGDFDRAGFTAGGNLSLTNGAWINGNTYLSGKSAPIVLKAGSLSVAGNGKTTLIASSTLTPTPAQAAPTTGDGGSIEITASSLSLTKGGQIQSSTLSQGKAGPVTINAGSITIDAQNTTGSQTGIFGTANRSSYGQAGTVTLNAAGGSISVANGGSISVQNDAVVPASQLGSIAPAGLSMTAKSITLDNNAQVTASTSGNVDASTIDIKTVGGDIAIRNGASIQGSTTGSGNATSIGIRSGGDLTISNGAFINGNTALSGRASAVSVTAANITLDGNGRNAIISSEANGPPSPLATGSGNLVDITASGTLSLINGGQIKSSSNTFGNAGIVKASAGNISIDGRNNSGVQTGIFNTTTKGGDSEEIIVTASNDLTLKNLGQINATSMAPTGKAGAITINTGSMTVDGMLAFTGKITLPDGSQRDTNGFVFSNISSEAGTNSLGQTGDVTVTASKGITLSNGGKISVSNLATVADPSGINNRADPLKPNLTISAKSIALDSNAQITASTSGNVDASKIGVTATAGDIDVKNGGIIEASTSSLGNAGIVNLTSAGGNINIASGGNVQSATSGQGKAGSVTLSGQDITIDGANRPTGISVTANPGSSGYTGSLTLLARGTFAMSKGSGLTAMNLATVSDPDSINNLADSQKPSLLVLAKDISLDTFAMITAETRGNVDASRIRIAATGPQTTAPGAINFDAGDWVAAGNMSMAGGASILGNTYLSGKAAPLAIKAGTLTLDKANLSSTANFGASGDAGSIAITVPGKLQLRNGATITTSTHSATKGDAGNIAIAAGSIAMDSSNINSDSGVDAGPSNPATPSSIGKAGSITLDVQGALSMSRSLIDTTTQAQGAAGQINIKAADISLTSASIQSNSKERAAGAAGKAGDAGAVVIDASGDLTLGSGVASSATLIHSSTATDGAGGEVKVAARNVTIDTLGYAGSLTGIMSLAMPGTAGVTTGNAGSVSVTVGDRLSLLNAGAISTTALARQGNAGTINVAADKLVMNGNGTITSDTLGAGAAGSVTVSARQMAMDASVSSALVTEPVGNTVPPNFLPLLTKVFGQGARVSSQAFDTATGDAGQVKVTIAQDLSVLNGSQISSATYSPTGAAKDVVVSAGSLLVDGANKGVSSSISAASANPQSSGQTGTVRVTVAGDATLSRGGMLSLRNDALASASRLADITPTTLELTAQNITLDSNAQITAATTGNVDASSIRVAAAGAQAAPTGAVSFDALNATGNLNIGKGASINGNTSLSGKGASVSVKAGTITLDGAGANAIISSESMLAGAPGGEVPATATGDGGSVDIAAKTLTLKNGGQIKTSTATFGDSGLATIAAENILIDGNFRTNALTGIYGSTSGPGDSREIRVSAGNDLSLKGLGQISASTTAGGQAGSISVSARTVTVDGSAQVNGGPGSSSINAEAGRSSSGKTGNITVRADEGVTLSHGGTLSVQNFARVSAAAADVLNNLTEEQKPRLSLSAPDITLQDARITAASTGNVNASNIDVTFSNSLRLDPSSIATSANTGDGGAISIRGGRMLVLDNSQITTSVSGLVGFNGNPANGGNINVSAETLLLLSGFIQANTAASDASGGNVSLALRNLVPSGNSLYLGGQTPYSFAPGVFGFNVIQAAAPTGLSGTIQISSPGLDLSGALSGLNAQMVNTGGMGRSPCQASAGSSFVQQGRGGFAPAARDLLGPETPPAAAVGAAPRSAANAAAAERLILTRLECIHE